MSEAKARDSSESRRSPGAWFAPFLTEARPWLSRFALPVRNDEVKYAYRTSREQVSCESPEDLVERVREEQGAVHSVAVPAYPRWIPPLLLFRPDPRLRKARSEGLARSFVISLLLGLALWALMHPGSIPPSLSELRRVDPSFLLLLFMFFGIMPLTDAVFGWWDERKLRKPEDWSRAYVEEVMFRSWIRKTPKWISLVGPIILCALFVVQLSVGGDWTLAELTDRRSYSARIDRSAFRAGFFRRWMEGEGEWWRLLTAGFLHGGILHLLFNGSALYFLGRVLVALAHPYLLALIFLASVLGGSCASYFLSDVELSVGASGGILGLLGFLVGLEFFRKAGLPTGMRSNLLKAILIISLFGFFGAFMIDNVAHAGGFAVGLVLSLILMPGAAKIGDYKPAKIIVCLSWASIAVLAGGIVKVIIELQRPGAFGIQF